jgi:hypothetical protein
MHRNPSFNSCLSTASWSFSDAGHVTSPNNLPALKAAATKSPFYMFTSNQTMLTFQHLPLMAWPPSALPGPPH